MGHRDHFAPVPSLPSGAMADPVVRPRRRPRVPRGLLAAAVAVVALVAGCSGGDAADYDEAFRADFEATCTDAYGRPGADQVCGCWYDQLQRAVPFEDLPALDDLVTEDFAIAPTRIPGSELDEPLRILAACVRFLGAEPTIGDPMPLPTTPQRPPPSTATTVPS